MQVSLQYAQEHLEDLASALDRGEEVEIARPEKSSIRLVVSNAPTKRVPGSRAHLFGAWEGKMALPTDEEWAAMDKEIADEMLNGPIFPSEHP